MDLHRIVRETLDEYPATADPGDIASFVFQRLEPHEYPDVIRLLLRSYVRNVMGDQRRTTDRGTQPTTDVLIPMAPPSAGSPAFRPSPKVAGIREAWREQLGSRVHGNGVWKTLGNCTYGDLRSAADERRRLSAENASAARLYETLAVAVEDSGAVTVDDLPDDVLKKILS